MASFGFFKIKAPFAISGLTADGLSKPYHVTFGAMINDGTPYVSYEGPQAVVRVNIGGDNSSFRLMALYEALPSPSGDAVCGRLLPSFVSLPFAGGYWDGFFSVQRMNATNNTFNLECFSLHPQEPVGGSSQSIEVAPIIVPPVPLPPGSGHRVVIRTELAKVASDGTLAWDGVDGSEHLITVKTGPHPSLAVDGVIQPWP